MSTSSQALPSTSRYRIASRIASGGMGAVYIGIQRGAAGFKRPVAIKRAHPHLLEDPSFRDTIITEARNASAVRHPNVVSVDDVEDANGELLLVMEYVEGTSLAHLLGSKKPLDPAVAARIIMDACAALHAIHTAKNSDGVVLGLVHRDVSPQNILVGTDGVARVTDFGIAKGHADPRRTTGQSRRGKFGYMAPEYLTASVFSPQSDIFAIGVVLWEAVTGRDLFKRKSPIDSIRLALEGKIERASSINPAVPLALDHVISRCLSASPAARFATMHHLSMALEAAVPQLGHRDDVTALVNGVAGEMLDEHRRAINAARCSLAPAGDPTMTESSDCATRDEELVPSSFVPGEADIFDTDTPAFEPREASLTAPKYPTKLRAGHPKFVAPTVPTFVARPKLSAKRTRASIALLVAFVAVLGGSTAMLVETGASKDQTPVAR